MILPKYRRLSPRALQLWEKSLQLEYDEEGRVLIKRGDGGDETPPQSPPPVASSTTSATMAAPTSSPSIPNPAPSSSSPPLSRPPTRGGSSGFFDGDASPAPRASQTCVPHRRAASHIDERGAVRNYTNLGGDCFGYDVGEGGSQQGNGTLRQSLHDPFFASVTPQTFALAGATIAAAILLILLFLSRTRKPWVQKLATFSMTVSLVTYMVVSIDTLQDQYEQGRYDADALRGVNQDTVCKIFAYIAEFAIYLAQVQTLMRIFPRKRDKVIIKWTGFGLIVLTMIFCALFQFLQPSAPPPSQRSTAWQIFIQILPPLSYLFSIALALIYAVSVIYFGITHRRVAFSIPAGLILAILSLVCITVPIIFFCLDIWKKFIVGWGQYIRSIASIGSTVIVWEWIDRIDESESKRIGKSAILGRRIFEDEFEIARIPTSPSQDTFRLREWGKKIHLPSILSGISGKASEWSMKLQSKLDRRVSSPTPPPVTEHTLSNLDSAIPPPVPGGSASSPSTSDDTRTTTTGDDTYTSTSQTGTSGATSNSPLVGGKRPKKKHHYPIARTANRTRQLTLTPSSTQSPQLERTRESVFEPLAVNEPSAPSLHPSDQDSLQDRPTSSNAPSFHSRESEDRRVRFSVLPGFTRGDYFVEQSETEKRGWTNDSRTP